MAVAFEGFSIREYASKMRGENVAKSWPFAGDVDEKLIESVLPPITVTKFRWWLDELEAARQAEDDAGGAETLEATPLGYRLCRGLEAPSISSNLTVHAGNCLSSDKMKRRAKSNSKAPKKRSIAEIFAVAPQIEKAASELRSSRIGEASGSRNSNSISSKKKTRKNKKRRNLLDKTNLLPVDNVKIKKKKKATTRKMKNHRDAFIAFKENATKLEGKTASIRTRNFSSSRDERYGSICRKKPRFKSSSSHEKHEAIVLSGFCKKQNKPDVPVRGILKKQGKSVVSDSDSLEALHSEKRVKFLDDVEVQGGRQSSSIQQSDVSARCAGVDKLIGRDEKSVLIDLTEDDDEGPGSGNLAQVTIEKEHLTDTRDGGNAENSSSPELASLRHCRKSLLTECSSTSQVPNHHRDMDIFTKGKTVVIDDSTIAENSRFLTYTNIQMPGSFATVSGSSGSFPGQILIQPCSAEDGLRLNSNHVEPASCPGDLDLFPVHNFEPRGPGADVLWQNPETPVAPPRLLDRDLNLVKAIPPMEKEDRASPDAPPLTFRLMGKDVAVVRSTNTQGLEDESTWTGKEISIEHHHPNDRFTLPGLLKSKGPVNLPLEPCKNLQYKSLVKAPKSLLLSPYINWRTDEVPERDRFTFTGSSNPGEQSHSPASFDFTGFGEPLVVGPRPGLPSPPRGSSWLIHRVPEPRYCPNPPRPRALGFDICFLRHDCGEHFQQDSSFRRPFKDLPTRPLHSSDWGRSTTTTYSVPCPNEIHRNHLSQTPPSQFNSSGNFTTYGSILRNSFGPLPAVRPQLLDAVPGIEQASIKNISYRNGIKSIDTMESPAFGVRTPDLFANTRKRPAVKASRFPDDLTR